MWPLAQLINKPINRPINQSINHSNNQSINQQLTSHQVYAVPVIGLEHKLVPARVAGLVLVVELGVLPEPVLEHLLPANVASTHKRGLGSVL